jgi:hypothetical protein
MPPPPPNPTPGFISLQQWLDANQGTVDAMGRQLADAGAAQAQKAQEGADTWAADQRGNPNPDSTGYGQALVDQQKASQTLQGWDTYGGLFDAAGQQYGKGGGYTPGQNTLDALLLGTAGPQQHLDAVQKQYGGLDTYLQGRDATYRPPKPGPVNKSPVHYAPTMVDSSAPPPSSSAGYMGLGSGYGSAGWSPGAANAGMSRPGASSAPAPLPPPEPAPSQPSAPSSSRSSSSADYFGGNPYGSPGHGLMGTPKPGAAQAKFQPDNVDGAGARRRGRDYDWRV